MSVDNDIIKELKELPYYKEELLLDYVLEDTEKGLYKLYDKYGFENVLSNMPRVFSYEKSVELYKKINVNKKKNKKPDKKIKVIATMCSSGYGGGAERVNAQIMTMLVEMGFKVVFISEEEKNILDFPYPDTVKRLVIPKIIDDEKGRYKSLVKYLKEEKVDLFINNSWMDSAILWDVAVVKYLDISYIHYCHSHFSYEYKITMDNLYTVDEISPADLVIAISENNAKFYQMCNIDSYLVNNPIPDDLKNIKVSNLNNNHILMPSRLETVKYPYEALKVFKKAYDKNNSLILDIVGGGSLEEGLKKYVVDNGLKDNVVFHGRKTSEEMASFYEKSSMLLFTSKLEGYPMVLLEAKAYGLPIIMFDLPFLTLTKDNKGVMKSEFGNLNDMANNIVKVMGDIDLKKKLGKESRESFEEFLKYDIKDEWSKIINIVSGDEADNNINYYRTKDLKDIEKNIIPYLLDSIKDGYKYSKIVDKAYRVGEKILFIPRKIKKIIKKH